MKCSRTSSKQPPIIAWKINGRRAKKRRRGGGRKEAFYWSICESWWQYQILVHALRHDRPGGWFQNRGVCLQAFPSFLPHPLPALLLTPLLRVLWLSFLVLCTETARKCLLHSLIEVWVYGSKPSLMSLLGSDDWTEMSCKTHFTRLFWLIVKFSLGLDWSGPTVLAGPSCSKDGYYHPQDNSLFSGYVY